MLNKTSLSALATLVMLSGPLLTACGGGGSTEAAAPVPAPPPPPPPPPGGITDAQRTAAADQTARTNAACSLTTLPEGFYWEIGDKNGRLASGSVVGNNTPTATQQIALASSSKWIYSTYVLEVTSTLQTRDLPFLHFTSGFIFPPSSATGEVLCLPTQTVGECAAPIVQNTAAINNFFYSAGHFQYHAANVMGLAGMGAAALTTEITSKVGTFDFLYLQTNLAGGLNASANGYAGFLRRMLNGGYKMTGLLGSNKICASAACAAGLVLSPAPSDEQWNYSLGHWVEDDPAVGDHAFSSAGALGFYPWIDASKTWYGVLARRAANPAGNEGVVSAKCGRLIRKAWVTGSPV